LGTWEQINNPNFKVVEFDYFKTQAGLPSFVLSVSEWIEKTNAISAAQRRRTKAIGLDSQTRVG
jgi:hypothetical protein